MEVLLNTLTQTPQTHVIGLYNVGQVNFSMQVLKSIYFYPINANFALVSQSFFTLVHGVLKYFDFGFFKSTSYPLLLCHFSNSMRYLDIIQHSSYNLKWIPEVHNV